MRGYGKIGPKFWIGSTGKKLRTAGAEAQVVALYLMTSPHANMLGLYYLPQMFIAHETGLGFEGASKGLASAIEAGFCEYDEASETVWVMEMAKYQIADELSGKDLRIKGVQNEYDSLPTNPFLSRFYDMYATAFCMSNKRDSEQVLVSPSKAPPKPLASQEQEQEQEHVLSGDAEHTPSPAAQKIPRALQESASILDYLNEKSGHGYKPVDANLKLIAACLKTSSADECRAVIDNRVKAWASDPKMQDYLRPATLFNASKFAQYVGQLGSTQTQAVKDWT